MKVIHIDTHKEKEMINVTSKIASAVKSYQWQHGVLTIYVPHTTAAIIINECVDPDVKRDLLSKLQKLVPRKDSYRHAEGNSDSHIMVTLTHTSQSVIIENGEIQLGSWQGIFFAEYDGPRQRKLWLQWLPA